jgi:hypothetical protein
MLKKNPYSPGTREGGQATKGKLWSMGFRMYMVKQDFWLKGGFRFAGFPMCCLVSLEMYP